MTACHAACKACNECEPGHGKPRARLRCRVRILLLCVWPHYKVSVVSFARHVSTRPGVSGCGPLNITPQLCKVRPVHQACPLVGSTRGAPLRALRVRTIERYVWRPRQKSACSCCAPAQLLSQRYARGGVGPPPARARFARPCRARLRLQAQTVPQAHGMPCETPATPRGVGCAASRCAARCVLAAPASRPPPRGLPKSQDAAKEKTSCLRVCAQGKMRL